MLSIAYIANIGFTIFSNFILTSILQYTPNHNINAYNFDFRNSISILLGLMITGPIIEELSTRLLLTNKIWHQFIGINLIFLIFMNWQISLGVFCFTIFRLFFKQPFYILNYWIILISCIAFALMHLNNYMNIANLDIVKRIITSLVIILPQFVLGFVLSITRIKQGINYSILLHSLINLPNAILVLIKIFDNQISTEMGQIIGVIMFGIFFLSPLFFIFSNYFLKYEV
jgi:Type II CAAX prenyl endopeptidase Rce1-like